MYVYDPYSNLRRALSNSQRTLSKRKKILLYVDMYIYRSVYIYVYIYMYIYM